jgi:hypothetical protein
VVKIRDCPTRNAPVSFEGTFIVRFRRRLSTILNIILVVPTSPARSPTLTARRATTPSMGDRIRAFERRVSPCRKSSSAALICAFAALTLAWAAAFAVSASSRFCCVMSPNSRRFLLRSYSRKVRREAVSASKRLALAISTVACNFFMTVSASRVSSLASGMPFFT